MVNYNLKINFTKEDLETIYTCKQKVVVLKHVEEGYNVTWISFRPLEVNEISWKTGVSIYSSLTEIQGGEQIEKFSGVHAESQIIYVYFKGYFNKETVNTFLGENSYAVSNGMVEHPHTTFGLAQTVKVNGEEHTSKPINAIFVPGGQVAIMTPTERISILLVADIEDSVIVGDTKSTTLCLDYSGAINEISIAYDTIKDEIDISRCTTFSDVEQVMVDWTLYYNNQRYQWDLAKLTPVEYN